MVVKAILVVMALTAGSFLLGCAGTEKGSQSVNSMLAECAKVVDRAERTACIDAAHRSQG